MTTQNTAVTQAKPRTAMAEYFKTPDFRTAVQQALPKHCSEDRFNRILLTALLKTPKLAECTRESLLEKVIQVASLGLECDGRRAHLIPFGNEVQLIVDYKGLVELIYRSGEVTKLHADIVCENDTFTYNKGEIVEHRIDFHRERGEPYAAYSEATMKSGLVSCCVMSKFEIEFNRSISKSKNGSPWTDHWGEMAKKTCIRRHSKLLPLSPDLREKIESDDDGEFEGMKQATPSPSVVAPNFLTDSPSYTTEGTAAIPRGGASVVNEPEADTPTTGILAPKQPKHGTVGALIGQSAPATESTKPHRRQKTATPPQEPPIEVASEVVPPAETDDIEPPPVAPAAESEAAQESEMDAFLKSNGVTWAQIAEKAKTFPWFGDKIPATVDELPEVQKHWLVKNIKGIAKNVLRGAA